MHNKNNGIRASYLGFIILFSQSLWSQNNQEGYSSGFNGVYGGLGLGLMSTRAKLTSNTSTILTNFISPGTFEIQKNLQENNSSNLDGLLMLSVGVGRLIGNSNFYAGIEGFYNPGTSITFYNENSSYYSNTEARTFIYFPTSDTELTQKSYNYGADIKLGHLFNDTTLTYIRVGVGFNRATIKSNYTLDYRDYNTSPEIAAFSYLNVNKTKTLPAIRLGLGGEYAVTNELHLNVDVIYTGYKSLKANGTSNTISPLDLFNNFNVVIPNGFSNTTRASNIQNVAAVVGIKYYIKN